MYFSDRGNRTHAEATAHEREWEEKNAFKSIEEIYGLHNFGGKEPKPIKAIHESGVKSPEGQKAQETLQTAGKKEIPLSVLVANGGNTI